MLLKMQKKFILDETKVSSGGIIMNIEELLKEKADEMVN